MGSMCTVEPHHEEEVEDTSHANPPPSTVAIQEEAATDTHHPPRRPPGRQRAAPRHSSHTRADPSAFRSILSAHLEPLGPPPPFSTASSNPGHVHTPAPPDVPRRADPIQPCGLQATLMATMEHHLALRQLALTALPEVHLLGSGRTILQLTEEQINVTSPNASTHFAAAAHARSLQNDVPKEPTPTTHGAPHPPPQQQQQQQQQIQCTVQPPSCPAVDEHIPEAIDSAKGSPLAPHFPPKGLLPPRRGTNPLHCGGSYDGSPTSSHPTSNDRQAMMHPLGSWSAPATLYAQSSGGIPNSSDRPSVSDAFGSHSHLSSRLQSLSSAASGPVTGAARNPLGGSSGGQ